MAARVCGKTPPPDYGDFILPPATMRRTQLLFRDCGGFPCFPKKKRESQGMEQEKRRPPNSENGSEGCLCGSVRQTATLGDGCPLKRQVRKKDEESLALVEECVMKYAAGGCFDRERCDLCDHDCTAATCHRISHTKTRKRKASPAGGVRPLHTAPALGIVSPVGD
ncbi:MAG: hypothetical protein ACI3X4_03525 [Bacteroidaceae bacterium]